MIDRLEPQKIFQGILDGEINRFPSNYWKQPGVENECAIITRYFIEEVLKWSDEEITDKMSESVFRKYKLSGMLEYVFERSYYQAIKNAYPGKFKAWQFRHVPRGYWENEKHVNEALTCLLTLTGKHKFNELTNADFLRFHMGGLMDYIARYDLYEKLDIDNIEKDLSLENVTQRISFSVTNTKSKRNRIHARIELPISMLEAIGVDKCNSEVTLSIEDGKIIIEKR